MDREAKRIGSLWAVLGDCASEVKAGANGHGDLEYEENVLIKIEQQGSSYSLILATAFR